MNKLLRIKIRDLAKASFAYIQLFQSYNLDFYCRGNLTLEEALTNAAVNKGEFIEKLNGIQEKPINEYVVDIEKWPLDLLADYIQKTHHRFTDQILIELRGRISDYLEKNSGDNDEIAEFKIPFEALAQEMGSHLKKEELILFPTIKRLVATRGMMEDPGDKTVKNPVDKMIHEHDSQCQLIKEIRYIFNGYTVDSESAVEVREIITLMKNLDLDLSLHLHLENNILFPKAVELERSKLS